MADEKPIIVIKKKGGHGGHHGGAWKVAYADFVTAMMAFFLVMWLVNSAETATKQSIASYFRKPGLFSSGSGTPLLIGEAGILPDSYAPSKTKPVKNSTVKTKDPNPKATPPKDAVGFKKYTGSQDTQAPPTEKKDEKIVPIPEIGQQPEKTAEELQKEALQKLAKDIKTQIAGSPELQKILGIVDVKLDADGLNIEIMDTEKTSMFRSGSAAILPDAQEAFEKLAGLIGKLPNKIDIVGHTDSKPFSSRPGGYSNWELSADRANAARKLLEAGGIPADRIASVVGKADTDLRDKEHPDGAPNRRITLRMKFDTSKKVDLSKNPAALEHINDAPPPTTAASPAATAGAGSEGSAAEPAKTQGSSSKPPKDPNESFHGFTPKKIVQGSKDMKTIPLPETDATPNNPAYIQKDKIFGDRPVLGPAEAFSTP